MGIDVELLALPAQSKLIDVVTQWDAGQGELLSFVPSILRHRRRSKDPQLRDAQYDQFIRAHEDLTMVAKVLDEIIEAHPGIETRHVDLDRRYDWLRWLLIQCAKTDEERQLAKDAIGGERRAAPESTSCQGFPINFTSQNRAQEIHRWLRDVTSEDLQRRYDPVSMEAVGVYKFFADPDYEAEMFSQISENLIALQHFYDEVVSHSECVLVNMV